MGLNGETGMDLGLNNGAPLFTFVSLVDLCVRAVAVTSLRRSL